MIKSAENARSYKKAGNLRNPKSLRDKLSELLPEEWAFDPLEDMVDRKPNSAEAWFELGEEERARGYFRDALASYEKAISLEGNHAEAFLRSGEACLALGEYNSAVKQTTKAIEQDPELVEAYSLRAFAYERLLNYEAAIKDHNVALILKGQPVRAKPRRSLTSEVIGNVYRFWVDKIVAPTRGLADRAIRSSYVQQKLKAMQAGIAKNLREAVAKSMKIKKSGAKLRQKIKAKTKAKRKPAAKTTKKKK